MLTHQLREKKREKTGFDYVSAVHESELGNLKPGVEPAHRFEVKLERDSFTEEKYELFDAYQRHVHHEGDTEISRAGFRRFLCSTPLHRHDEGAFKTGSFHQVYRLDGRLIAIGVLDLMPHAVSGVYFIYHPDFEKYSFGKLSALREAALAVEGGHQFYYMGYYIHSCKKMRYKGDYRTQHVLDYDTQQWHPLDEKMRLLMDQRKWVSMSREERIEKHLEGTGSHPASDGQGEVHSLPAPEDAIVDAVYHVDHPTALEAQESGFSVLKLGMPGTVPLATLEEEINLDEMKVTLGKGGVHRMRHLVSWHDGSVTDGTTLKGIMAEFAACVGPVVAEECVLDFSR